MQTKKLISILIVVIVAILMLTTVVASAEAVSAAKVKVTWNANGGKIGTANTKVISYNKGAKVKKLPTTPKRTGYTFSGWYTKKSGGKKISSGTKVQKKKSYYAQWKKILNRNEKELVGSYTYSTNGGNYWTYNSYNTDKWVGGYIFANSFKFNSDGTYEEIQFAVGSNILNAYFKSSGTWSASNGKIYLKNRIINTTYPDGKKVLNEKRENEVYTYSIEIQDGKKGIIGFLGNYFYKKD